MTKKKNPLVIPNAEILDIEHIIKDPKCDPKQFRYCFFKCDHRFWRYKTWDIKL